MTAGRLVATINKYIRGKTPAIERKSAVYAMLKAKAKIKYNASGNETEWNILNNLVETNTYDDLEVRDFNPIVLYKRAKVDWAAYDNASALSKLDLLVNRGQEKMSDMLQDQLDNHIESMHQKFMNDMYVDGTGTRQILGRKSFLGTGSDLTNGFYEPSDTYANVSTALGNYGGTAPSDETWPRGSTETPKYDFHSPIIADTTSTYWDATNNTWANNCLDILRESLLITESRSNQMIETVTMKSTYFNDLARQMELKEQLVIQGGSNTLANLNLGFRTLNFWGAEVVWDHWVPGGEFHGFAWDPITLYSLQSDLFSTPEKEYESLDKSWRIGCDFYGQLVHESIRGQLFGDELT